MPVIRYCLRRVMFSWMVKLQVPLKMLSISKTRMVNSRWLAGQDATTLIERRSTTIEQWRRHIRAAIHHARERAFEWVWITARHTVRHHVNPTTPSRPAALTLAATATANNSNAGSLMDDFVGVRKSFARVGRVFDSAAHCIHSVQFPAPLRMLSSGAGARRTVQSSTVHTTRVHHGRPVSATLSRIAAVNHWFPRHAELINRRDGIFADTSPPLLSLVLNTLLCVL